MARDWQRQVIRYALFICSKTNLLKQTLWWLMLGWKVWFLSNCFTSDKVSHSRAVAICLWFRLKMCGDAMLAEPFLKTCLLSHTVCAALLEVDQPQHCSREFIHHNSTWSFSWALFSITEYLKAVKTPVTATGYKIDLVSDNTSWTWTFQWNTCKPFYHKQNSSSCCLCVGEERCV